MKLKFLMDEDFVNYKKPSMFLGFPTCSFKCCREGNFPIEVCQNCNLAKETNIKITEQQIVDRYLSNPITSAIVCGGLEPFDSWDDLLHLIEAFRQKTNDPIIIFTGYNETEITDRLNVLKKFENIIIKVGRYIPNKPSIYDEILGITLASDNQHAIVI